MHRDARGDDRGSYRERRKKPQDAPQYWQKRSPHSSGSLPLVLALFAVQLQASSLFVVHVLLQCDATSSWTARSPESGRLGPNESEESCHAFWQCCSQRA